MSPGHAPLVIYPGAQILGPSLIIHSHPENSTGRDELHAPNMELCHRGSGVINKGHDMPATCHHCQADKQHSYPLHDMFCQNSGALGHSMLIPSWQATTHLLGLDPQAGPDYNRPTVPITHYFQNQSEA
jgi:hypothetical protein